MVRTLILSVVLVSSFGVVAAQDLVLGATYELAGQNEIIPFDRSSAAIGNAVLTPADPDIVVISTAIVAGVDGVVLRFLPFIDRSSYAYRTFVGSSTAPLTFWMSQAAFLAASPQRLYRSGFSRGAFSLSPLTLPVKVRADPFDFEQSLSLGPALGYRWRMTRRSNTHATLVASVGISSVDVTRGDSVVETGNASDRSALYLSVGFLFDVGVAQTGLLFGIDAINGEDQDAWDYQAEPWVAIGLGLNVFSGSNTDANATSPD